MGDKSGDKPGDIISDANAAENKGQEE